MNNNETGLYSDGVNPCQICKKPYDPKCDWNQGRCPHHPPTTILGIWIPTILVICSAVAGILVYLTKV